MWFETDKSRFDYSRSTTVEILMWFETYAVKLSLIDLQQ